MYWGLLCAGDATFCRVQYYEAALAALPVICQTCGWSPGAESRREKGLELPCDEVYIFRHVQSLAPGSTHLPCAQLACMVLQN